MTDRADFLFELGTEELPPKALLTLSNALTQELMAGLQEAGLAMGEAKSYAAPRRLAVLIRDMAFGTENQMIERKGPALASAFDAAGNPSRALEGFAKSCGVHVADLQKIETDKGTWLVHKALQPGKTAREILPAALARALDKLPTPKRMRWGNSEVEFIRPVHWVVALHGDAVIDTTILGLKAGRQTWGHRFHNPAALTLEKPSDYASRLETQGFVLADFEQRRAKIKAQIEHLAEELGGTPRIDADLLDEVTALVEWPVAVAGQFEASFLAVPHEALISTMQDNQKYFALVDAQNRLLPWFITIANIDSKNPAAVREGNERVIRPRFADALFFWNEDRKQPLAAHLNALKTVVFQQKLGTLFDKTERVERLARHIAEQIGAPVEHAARAARLSKCDLQSKMVGEFPELQGIMGRYLATHDGEAAEVAQALDDYYLPRRAGDNVPASPVAQALALAERLDTLVGIFAIAGMEPTGSKDPFALRRAALGVLRILIEKKLDLDLHALLQFAYEAEFPGNRDRQKPSPAVDKVFDFMLDRMRAYAQDRGIRHDVFDAVLATRPTRPLDFEQRLQAVNDFLALPQAEALAAANKRISNILKKLDTTLPSTITPALLIEPAEKTLAERVQHLEAELTPLFASGNTAAALGKLAHLRDAVDAFFDSVMVMADDEALRNNRIALLHRLRALFLGIADLALLNG
ncbi:MAG: glycine--tRNA ligase subunit beta [Halothiobacillus sp. 28-55-5]|nr:MAG: glycine--tRNA ligase subunit beta [Halothiobacillus sp. 28-55-5]